MGSCASRRRGSAAGSDIHGLPIATGFVPTKLASTLLTNDDARRANVDATLLGRLGTPQDMAAAVAFLASDDASYITAETIVVAGGMQSRL